MSKTLAIVMVHQGAELYGSDRSFVSALCALRARHLDARIDVVLPEPGPLVDHVARYANAIRFDEAGVLRKQKLKARPAHTLMNMARAWRRFRRMFADYDICYVNTVVCVAAILALRSKRTGAYVHVREIPSPLALRVFNAMLKLSNAALIYNSNATAVAFGLPGVVIHNGVEVPGDAAPVASRSGRALRLVIVGRINPWKGQQFVLDALTTLGRDVPVEIRIVGDVFPGYEALLAELHVSAASCAQRVEIFGFTDDPSAHYAWADFALVPSILPEPFGRVAIESFACGRPVIAAATGGLVEIVTEGTTGFLFAADDAKDLLRAVERARALTEDEYARFSVAARERYEQAFTVKTYMRAVADALQAPHRAGGDKPDSTRLRRNASR